MSTQVSWNQNYTSHVTAPFTADGIHDNNVPTYLGTELPRYIVVVPVGYRNGTVYVAHTCTYRDYCLPSLSHWLCWGSGPYVSPLVLPITVSAVLVSRI